MKKIISILASLAMMVSVSATAFAAAPEGAAPVVEAVVTDSVDAGWYVVTINLSNLGTINATGTSKKPGGTRLSLVNVTINSDVALTDVYDPETGVIAVGSVYNAIKNSDYSYSLAYVGGTTAKGQYPTTIGDSMTEVEEAIVFEFEADSKPNITIADWKIKYTEWNEGAAVAGSDETLYPVHITEKYDGANGYVWGVSFSQSGALDSLTATFEDSNGNSQSAEATNVSAAAGFTGSGVVSFDIGLNTTKTITSATFDVVSGTGTTSFGSGTGTWN